MTSANATLFEAAGREYFIDENLIAQGELRTDAAGQARFHLVGDLGGDSSSQRWLIEASIGDESGQAIYEQTSLIVHQGLFYIGARVESAVVRAGEDSRVQLIAVDWGSQPLASQPIEVEVVEVPLEARARARPDQRTRQHELGSHRAPSQQRTPGHGRRWQSRICLPAAGWWHLQNHRLGQRFRRQRDSHCRKQLGGWRRLHPLARAQNDRVIELVPAQSDYRIGETAKVLITSPFPGAAQALVTIERGEVLHTEVLTLRSNSPLVRI